MCPSQEYQRKLHPDDLPLRAQLQRVQKGEQCHFLVRKNPHYPRRKLQLTPIIEASKLSAHNLHLHNQQLSLVTTPTKEPPTDAPADGCTKCVLINNNNNTSTINNNNNSTTINNNNNTTTINNNNQTSNNTSATESTPTPAAVEVTQTPPRYISPYTSFSPITSSTTAAIGPDTYCKMCRNNFRSCEFCNKNVTTKLSTRLPGATGTLIGTTTTYNPVYNIREIRSVCNSFASINIDKKIAENTERAAKALSFSGSLMNSTLSTANNTSIVQEVVNNNPAKGYGSYVYI